MVHRYGWNMKCCQHIYMFFLSGEEHALKYLLLPLWNMPGIRYLKRLVFAGFAPFISNLLPFQALPPPWLPGYNHHHHHYRYDHYHSSSPSLLSQISSYFRPPLFHSSWLWITIIIIIIIITNLAISQVAHLSSHHLRSAVRNPPRLISQKHQSFCNAQSFLRFHLTQNTQVNIHFLMEL